MHFCYMDESGNSETINNATDNTQPMLIVAGIFIDASKVKKITTDFIQLKLKFFPKNYSNVKHDLNILIKEIKGSEIRKDIRDNPPNSAIVKHRYRFLDEVLKIIKNHDAKIVARIWVKGIGQKFPDQSIYTITTQNICLRFQKYLISKHARGLLLADFRDPKRNSYVAHSIFTQKHKANGDAYPELLETPVFGISDNHACLQISDLIASTFLYPMAAQVYCKGIIKNSFVNNNFDVLKNRYSKRIKSLQYHCKFNETMFWGITVKDNLGNKHGTALFL